ncbi:MAG: MerR family DNA-binding protein [Rhodothermales bacterium]
MDSLTTSQVAEHADVNIHTVRYYEKRGLLPEPPRMSARYRQYGTEHVSHLRFIKRAQALGFTLEEIGELLDLRVEPGAGSEVRHKTSEKIDEIEAKIRDLKRIQAKLMELADACEHHGSSDSCRVLDALEDPAKR